MLGIPANRSLWAPSGFLDIRILYELAGDDNLGSPAHTIPLFSNMTRIVAPIVLSYYPTVRRVLLPRKLVKKITNLAKEIKGYKKHSSLIGNKLLRDSN